MARLLNLTTLLSAALILLVLLSLRRAHIRVEYSVSWLTSAVVLLTLSRAQSALAWTASMLGIANPLMALLLISLGVFLLVFFRFSVIISHLKDANIALAQKVAVLEYRLQSLHEERKTATPG
ncbi:MAG: DUF2304 domain-containing protein [Bryobacteraceae bacterium]